MALDEKIRIVELEKILKEYELTRLHTDVIEKVIILVIASLGLIAALAWDTALNSLFKRWFSEEQSLLEEIVYALAITAIAATVSVLLGRYLRRKKKKTLAQTIHGSSDNLQKEEL